MKRRERVTLIPGDGIGPEVTDSAVKIIKSAGAKIRWQRAPAGTAGISCYGTPLPDVTLESIKRNGIVLKGPLDTPTGKGYKSINVTLRQEFDLYINMRPFRSFEGVKSRYSDVNLLLFRENTEELYTGKEEYIWDKPTKEIIGAKIEAQVTLAGSRRFFKYVYNYAWTNKHRRITIGHKGNILKLIHGEMFLNEGLKMIEGLDLFGITVDSRILDNLNMQLVLDPTKFDVIAVPNLPGDLLSDTCAGFIGGLGFAPGANIGDKYAIFEAVHGTAPDIAGQNKANPTALILSACMLLDHIGFMKEARVIRAAVRDVIREGKKVTRDINPSSNAGTTGMTDAIIEKINEIRSDPETLKSV